jgi:hypothetical protein
MMYIYFTSLFNTSELCNRTGWLSGTEIVLYSGSKSLISVGFHLCFPTVFSEY